MHDISQITSVPTEERFYCVEQYDRNHHEHRWIFKESDFKAKYPDLTIRTDGTSNAYIYGGHPCRIKVVKSKNDCMLFLINPALGFDSHNPTIEELNTYILTVDGGFGSITREIIMSEGINGNLLTKYDPRLNKLFEKGVKKEDLKALAETNITYEQLQAIIDEGTYKDLLDTVKEYSHAPNYIPEIER